MFSIRHTCLSVSILSTVLIVNYFHLPLLAQTSSKQLKATPNNPSGKSHSLGDSTSARSTTQGMYLTGGSAPEECSQQAQAFKFKIANMKPGNSDCATAQASIIQARQGKPVSEVIQSSKILKCTYDHYMKNCSGKITDFDPVASAAAQPVKKDDNSNGAQSAAVGGAALAAALPVVAPLVGEYFDRKGRGTATDGVVGTAKSPAKAPVASDSAAASPEPAPAVTQTNTSSLYRDPIKLGTTQSSSPNFSDVDDKTSNLTLSLTSPKPAPVPTIAAPAPVTAPEDKLSPPTEPITGNGFNQMNTNQMGNMEASGIDKNKFSQNSDNQWDSNNPAPNPLKAPEGLSAEAKKQIDGMKGTFNEDALKALGEVLNELVSAASVLDPAAVSHLNSVPGQYKEISQACGAAAERAETWCVEEKSPGVKQAMTALSVGLPVVQAAMGSSDTCSKANQLIDVVSKGITLAQGTCAALKATCDITCGRASANIKQIDVQLKAEAGRLSSIAYSKAASDPTNASTYMAAQVQTSNASIMLDKFRALDFTPKQNDAAVIARVEKCGSYAETLVKTGLGLASMMMSNNTLKDCKEKTKASAAANTDKCSLLENAGSQECLCKREEMKNTANCLALNDLNKKCALSEFANTNECYCHKNPGGVGCNGKNLAALNMNGGLQKMTKGSDGGNKDGSLTGGPNFNLGDDKDSGAVMKKGAASLAGGLGSSGGGASGMGAGGSGGGGDSAADAANPNALGKVSASLEGSSGFGGFNFGRKDKDSVNAAKQAIKDQRAQGRGGRSIASENGITGPVGKSLWEKVKQTYNAKSSTLIEK